MNWDFMPLVRGSNLASCLLHLVISFVYVYVRDSFIFRSSPGDDLIDWNSGVSVHTSVHLYVHKKFFLISI